MVLILVGLAALAAWVVTSVGPPEASTRCEVFNCDW
jgi:hypothetical protein